MKHKGLLSVAFLVSMIACVEMFGSYQPILDGQSSQIYNADLQTCQNLAHGQSLSENLRL